jgi:hypothetical protein
MEGKERKEAEQQGVASASSRDDAMKRIEES